MNTRQEAKKFLSKHQNIRKRIASLNIQLEEIKADCGVGSAVLTGMPSGSAGNTSTEERIYFRYESIIERITSLRESLSCEAQQITSVIELIEDGNENQLLTLRYVQGLTWEEIADTMHYSWRHIHRIHASALDDVIECHNKIMI